LIGDQAIRFRDQFGGRFQIIDLGAEWKKQTGLPFVYALWLIRPELKQKREVAAELRSLGKQNRAQLDLLIAAQPEAERAFCEFYFRECLRFSFGEEEKQGFQRFAELCARHHLIPSIPPPLELV
jgi:predicted solute-binding protein